MQYHLVLCFGLGHVQTDEYILQCHILFIYSLFVMCNMYNFIPYSIKGNRSWEANSCLRCQKVSAAFCETEGSFLFSQGTAHGF
jgi:hypothetical protein